MTRRRKSAVYTPEQRTAHCEAILKWIAEGKPLTQFCRLSGNPPWPTVYDWLAEDDDFARGFARARDVGSAAIAEEALAIADKQEPGQIVTQDKEGTKIVTEDMLGHRKLRVETRLKLLAKWNPKKLRIDLPPIKCAADIPAAFDAAVAALREGTIDSDELEKIERLLAGYRASFGEAELERKFRELEARLAAGT